MPLGILIYGRFSILFGLHDVVIGEPVEFVVTLINT